MTMPHHPSPSSAPPLWAPHYGATFKDAVRRFFKKYATFSGRASRSEYWWWALISFVVVFILNIIIAAGSPTTTETVTMSDSAQAVISANQPGAMVAGVLMLIWGLATLVPSLALIARRLHDANLSAWLILLGLVPILGGLALLVMMLLPSNPQGQRFDQPQGGPAYTGYVSRS